ncbi:MAG TPA: 3-oxoacyl-ACP reductase [Ramlibacter sp.]|uniref:3-oxoacyl-ACP reductase n=1 Tax=Ramlibacter sp. TaxID=1917967 RepID=UPI002ED2119D
MTDRLLDLANTPWAAPIVRALRLPRPRVLARRTAPRSPQEFAGREVQVLEGLGGFAAASCSEGLASQGAGLSGKGSLHAVVVDATGCTTADSLAWLHAQVPSAVGRLADSGRVLLLANGDAQGPEAAACARAIEGFTRSLAKEAGRRGGTANCIYLAPSALPALAGPLGFFCSDRSAYVSGQALRLREAQAAPALALQGRTAVVTGATGGIGIVTAERLAADGMFVVCVDVPATAAALDALARRIGGSALPLDITASDAGRQIAEAVSPRGGVDVLVHNAGITRDRTLARMTRAEWDSVLAVNFRAVLAIDRALDEANALRPDAREICLASISGIAGNAGQTNYAASKAALIGYAEERARELADRGITVNAVAPGFIETAMTDRIPFMVREVGRRLNALMQGGQPADVAEAIAFLARADAQGISGQTLRVCGQSFLGA